MSSHLTKNIKPNATYGEIRKQTDGLMPWGKTRPCGNCRNGLLTQHSSARVEAKKLGNVIIDDARQDLVETIEHSEHGRTPIWTT